MSYQLKNPMDLKQQQGVVLVVALFIVVLVTVMATAMMSRLERDTHRATLIIRNIQAGFYAQGSIAWAIDQLRKDWEEQKPNRVIDKVPYREEADVNGYHIVSLIEDMQGRFNLNNLNNPESQQDFARLLKVIDPSLNEAKAENLIHGIFDWIMPNVEENEYSQYYMHLPIPYRAGHRLMAHVSELHLIKGMTPKLYQKLLPYITALPEPTAINIQTAQAPVLMTLSPNMKAETAISVVKFRRELPIISVSMFLSLDAVQNLNISKDKITVSSSYFLLKTTVSIENQQLVLYTLLQRLVNQNKAIVNILWQSKGVP